MTGGFFGIFGGGQSIQEIDRFPFVLLTEVGVSHRHGKRFVSQDLLKFFQRATSHQEMACKSVPEVVESEVYYSERSNPGTLKRQAMS